MADAYIDSTLASGLNDGSDWDNAYNAGTNADWSSAATRASAAGDVVYVSNDNLSNSGDVNFNVNANHTRDNPLKVIVKTPSGATGGTVVSGYSQTADLGQVGAGDGGTAHFACNGHMWAWGLRIDGQDLSTFISNAGSLVLQNSLYRSNKTTSETLTFGSESAMLCINSDIEFSGTNGGNFNAGDGSSLTMIGGALTITGSLDFIAVGSVKQLTMLLSGVDCTGVSSSAQMITNSGGESGGTDVRFENCKWPATLPTLVSTPGNLKTTDRIILSQDQAILRAEYRQGLVIPETSITRSGGANSDGSSPYTLKVEASSLATRTTPMKHLLAISNYGDITGTTIKVHMASNTGVALTSDQIWIQVSASRASAHYQAITTTAIEETPTTYTDESGSEVWYSTGTTDLTGYEEQSMSVSPAVATEGLIYVWLFVAADFDTTYNLYVCPKLDIA